MTVAALYVDESGPYSRMRGVDAWGEGRDARRYLGPHPVVAHPACGPWGRFWWAYKGGEGGAECGLFAIQQVRRFGGVLEHPAYSRLWGGWGPRPAPTEKRIRPWTGDRLPRPGERPDRFGGYTLAVNQVDWGHLALKPTWLYIVGCPIAQLPPLPSPRIPTHQMTAYRGGPPEVPKPLRHLTPPAFARWLVAVARCASRNLPDRPQRPLRGGALMAYQGAVKAAMAGSNVKIGG